MIHGDLQGLEIPAALKESLLVRALSTLESVGVRIHKSFQGVQFNAFNVIFVEAWAMGYFNVDGGAESSVQLYPWLLPLAIELALSVRSLERLLRCRRQRLHRSRQSKSICTGFFHENVLWFMAKKDISSSKCLSSMRLHRLRCTVPSLSRR